MQRRAAPGQVHPAAGYRPVSDEVIGFALVRANDQAHLRRFLLQLKYWGFLPSMVVSDGSNLYPATLAEV